MTETGALRSLARPALPSPGWRLGCFVRGRQLAGHTRRLFPPTEDGYVLALTYGSDTDWAKNVLAADGCELRTRGRVIRLVSPRLFHDETRRAIRPLERQVLRVLGVADFLSLKTAPAARQRLASPDRLIAGSDGTPLLPPSSALITLTIHIRLIERLRSRTRTDWRACRSGRYVALVQLVPGR